MGQKPAAFLPPTWCRPHSSVTGPAQQPIVHGLSQKGSFCSLSSIQQGHRVTPHPAGYSQVSDTPLHLKDQAVQTEVTSYFTGHSDVDTSHDIPKESRELLKQVSARSPQALGTKPRGKQPGRHRNCDNHTTGLSPAPLPPEALGQGGRQQCQPAPTTSHSWALASPECPVAHRGQLCLCSVKGTQHKANPPTTAFSAAGGTEAESGPAAQPSPAAGATGSHPGPGAAECAAAEPSQRGHSRPTPKSGRAAATGEGK